MPRYLSRSSAVAFAVALHSSLHQVAWLAAEDTDVVRVLVGAVHVGALLAYAAFYAPSLPVGVYGNSCTYMAHTLGVFAAQSMGCTCVLLRHIFFLPW